MRPVRKSSEGPEVVSPGFPSPLQSPDKYLVPFSGSFDRPSTIFQQKHFRDPQAELNLLPSLPKSCDHLSFTSRERHRRHRPIGTISISLLALFTFLLGGGIGGGVGGALVAKKQARISR